MPKTIDFRALPEYISSRWQRGNPKTCENQMAFYAAALLSKECCRVSVRKSKTFQGALKHHIKTVHENCVSSSSKTSRLSTYRLKRNMFERLRLTEVESKIILLFYIIFSSLNNMTVSPRRAPSRVQVVSRQKV